MNEIPSQAEDDNNVLTNLLSNLKRGNMQSIRRSVINKKDNTFEPKEDFKTEKNEINQNRTIYPLKSNIRNNNFFKISNNSRELN